MNNKIILKQTVVVEGKYDKIKLSSFIDANIIETGGFRIYKDKEKLRFLRRMADTCGLIIITDSDTAGFKIRNYICGSLDKSKVINVFIPDILGKEKRKEKPSAEGKLGVEGVSKQVILEALNKAGVFGETQKVNNNPITKADFADDGLSGGENSSLIRQKLLKELNLPERMSANTLISTLNAMMTKEEYKKVMEKIK